MAHLAHEHSSDARNARATTCQADVIWRPARRSPGQRARVDRFSAGQAATRLRDIDESAVDFIAIKRDRLHPRRNHLCRKREDLIPEMEHVGSKRSRAVA
jgi:hypothetical protein